MALLDTGRMNLVDLGKAIDRDGKIAKATNMLSQSNTIVSTGVMLEGNNYDHHRIHQVVGLPQSYFRMVNQGYPSSKSRTVQVDEQYAMLFNKAIVDVDLADGGRLAALRAKEGRLTMESMSQTMASTALYGDRSNPEQMVGFMPRYSDLSAASGENIITAGGVGSDNASILLVGWNQDKVSYRYPQGTTGGITSRDLGNNQQVTDRDGNSFTAQIDEWKWKLGLAIEDWRYVVRICNIDVSAVKADPTGATINLINLMIEATHHIPNLDGCRPEFYMNRTLLTRLDIQAANRDNLNLTVGMEEGKMKTKLRGIPINKEDQMVNNETLVA